MPLSFAFTHSFPKETIKYVITAAPTPAKEAKQSTKPSRSDNPIPTMKITIAGAVLVPGIGIIMKTDINTTSNKGTICIPRPVKTNKRGFTNNSVFDKKATAAGTNFSKSPLEKETFSILSGNQGVCRPANICNANSASTIPNGML